MAALTLAFECVLCSTQVRIPGQRYCSARAQSRACAAPAARQMPPAFEQATQHAPRSRAEVLAARRVRLPRLHRHQRLLHRAALPRVPCKPRVFLGPPPSKFQRRGRHLLHVARRARADRHQHLGARARVVLHHLCGDHRSLLWCAPLWRSCACSACRPHRTPPHLRDAHAPKLTRL